MKSIRETLSIEARQNNESTNKIISEQILKDYEQGIFRSLADLASECHVSESVITKFAKNLGFSGFREFVFTLKTEYDHYYISTPDFSATKGKDFLTENFVKFYDSILENRCFLDKLVNDMKRTKKVLILSSYMLFDTALYFKNMLSASDIDVVFNEITYYNRSTVKKLKGDWTIVVLISGPDNATLVECWNLLDDKRRKDTFCFGTQTQEYKIPTDNKMILKVFEKYIGYEYRRLFFDMLLIFVKERFIE